MKIVALIAKRFLVGKKDNRFLSFISFVSLFGVCLGVAALTVVMSVMEGFEAELRSIITGTHSHIVLYSSRQIFQNRFEIVDRVNKIAEDEIVGIHPFVFSEVMLAKGSRVVGTFLEGIEEEGAKATTRLSRYLYQGEFPTRAIGDSMPTILLGKAIAEALNAEVGDKVVLISPYFEQGAMQPRSLKFRVGGLYSSGMHEYDSKYAMIEANQAREFLQLSSASASAFKIATKDPQTSKEIANLLEMKLGPGYRARDWTDLNKNLLYAIRLQKVVIFIILTAIIVVAAFNIMSTLVMMLSEKKREISILKAMGLSPRTSGTVFLVVGLIIGVSGAIAGIALGLGLGQVLAKTRFIQLPPDVYMLPYLPVNVEFSTLALIFFSALTVSLLATLYPSIRVGLESPVEGLRYE